MTEVFKCDKCGCEIPDNEYGVCTASHFMLEILQGGVWNRYHGHFCESCKDEFLAWLGVEE